MGARFNLDNRDSLAREGVTDAPIGEPGGAHAAWISQPSFAVLTERLREDASDQWRIALLVQYV